MCVVTAPSTPTRETFFPRTPRSSWWHIEFLSRHKDDLPWRSDLTYNVPIRKRWRRNFYLSERKLAEILKLTRTTVRKHLSNFQAKGLLVVVKEARFAPSMTCQRRATTYALGPDFHCMPDIQPSDGTDEHDLLSWIQRVGHKSVNSKNTRVKNSKSKTQLLEEKRNPEKVVKIEAINRSNGKPLPVVSNLISDLQIENINSRDLPRHLHPQFTFPSRLKAKYLAKGTRATETPVQRKERLDVSNANGVGLFEAVLRNVEEPGEVGRCASEDCPKGIPYHPGYAKYEGRIPLDIQDLVVHPSLNQGLTRYRIPQFNLPQMKASDPRRPKCRHRINNDRTKGRCDRTMRLALNVENGTCYWRCTACSKHSLPVSLNYTFWWDRRDGLGSWRDQYPHSGKLVRAVQLKLDQIRHELTAERQDEIQEAICTADSAVLRKFFDIHIRGDKEWMEIMHQLGDLESEDA